MKVWIVEYSDYDYSEITHVFDTERKAEQEAEWSGGIDKGYSVTEFDVE